jgi:hypothetical protein
MINHRAQVWIHRPVDQVFAFLSNKENDLLWQSGLVEVRQAPGPLQVGSRIAEVYSFLGRKIDGTLEVTEYKANRKITTKSTAGPFPIQYTYTLEPAKDGTQFTIDMQMRPEGFFALTEPIVGANLKKDLETGLATLKQVLEK